MNHINIEIKAKSSKEQQNKIRQFLIENNANVVGVDHQIDTYFKVEEKGRRLKIRKGNIENALIDYYRENKEDSKKSEVVLQPLSRGSYDLEKITRQTHDVLIEVKKKREIYFIDNVKFHIDNVENIGRFIEIEAISEDNLIPVEKLQEQCDYYQKLFEIKKDDLIKFSYSDMLLK